MTPTMTLDEISYALRHTANIDYKICDSLADAIDAHLAERDAEVLQDWKSLLANLASVVRVQNGNLHEDINKLLAHADALLAQPSKAQPDPMQELADQAQELDMGYGKAQGREDAVAEIEHFANKVSEMRLLPRGMLLGIGNHKLYSHPAKPAAEPAVPDGWVLVPREPTEEMYKEGMNAHYEAEELCINELAVVHYSPKHSPKSMRSRSNRAAHAYKGMLAAAPKGVI